jgi:hypothetical protein
LEKNHVEKAVAFSNSLDALLWRNAKQTVEDSSISEWHQNALHTASLELQDCLAK